MLHARKDYNRIQDPLGIIPDNEPVFLLRGQDALTIPVMTRYCELLQQYEVNNKLQLIEQVQDHIRKIYSFQRSESGKVKLPDIKSEKEIEEILSAIPINKEVVLEAIIEGLESEVKELNEEIERLQDQIHIIQTTS